MQEADNRVKVYLARVIYESGKPDDAADIIQPLFDAKYQFQKEDRNLIITIWQAVINPIRTAIINMKDVSQPGDNIHLAITSLKEILNKKLDDIIQIVSADFIPSTPEEDLKAFFLKLLADFQRYKVECIPESDKPALIAESRKNYEKSIDYLRAIPIPHVEQINQTYLNYAILIADYCGDKQKAYDLIFAQHHELSVSLEKYPADIREKIQDIIDLMKENIDRWYVPPEEE